MVALGIQNDYLPPAQVDAAGVAIHAQWRRIIAVPGQTGVADTIRGSHAVGLKVILTVGGNGTNAVRTPVQATLRWIEQLPRAERYTWTNEPDIVGPEPCTYRRRWMRLRRVLGRALLWGDLSPSGDPIGFTQRAMLCGPVPRQLDIAVHPYQWSDPLAPGEWPGGIGNLGRMTRSLRPWHVRWWLTEFGYPARIDDGLAAWMWRRAIRQADRHHARVLVAYTAAGPTWDTNPREESWATLESS